MPPKPSNHQPRTIFIKSAQQDDNPLDLDINFSVGALTNKLHANVLASEHFATESRRPQTRAGLRFTYKPSTLAKESPPPPKPMEEHKEKEQEDEVAKKRCFCF